MYLVCVYSGIMGCILCVCIVGLWDVSGVFSGTMGCIWCL